MKNRLVYSKTGRGLTKRSEGCDFVAYQDQGGKWTIAYGHTEGVHYGMTCTQEEADEWLEQDTLNAVNAVNDLVEIQLNQEEFDALVDFVFNLGIGAFEHSTLLKDLNAGKITEAESQFALWDHVDGKVVAGLLRRRLAEKTEFES